MELLFQVLIYDSGQLNLTKPTKGSPFLDLEAQRTHKQNRFLNLRIAKIRPKIAPWLRQKFEQLSSQMFDSKIDDEDSSKKWIFCTMINNKTMIAREEREGDKRPITDISITTFEFN